MHYHHRLKNGEISDQIRVKFCEYDKRSHLRLLAGSNGQTIPYLSMYINYAMVPTTTGVSTSFSAFSPSSFDSVIVKSRNWAFTRLW
jgi:hypothetical protein